jgi:hypothetical protein
MATQLSLQGQGAIVTGTVSVNPPSIASAAVGEVTLTITGATVGDKVVMSPPAAGLTAGLVVCDARVSAADTVKVRIAKPLRRHCGRSSSDLVVLPHPRIRPTPSSII